MSARTETSGREPVAVAADGGEACWWMGSLAVIGATGAKTGGAMTIVDVTDPPGAAAPLHVHHREDESFFILEGGCAGARTATSRAPRAAACC